MHNIYSYNSIQSNSYNLGLSLSLSLSLRHIQKHKDGNGASIGEAKGWGLHPCLLWFCLAFFLPYRMTKKISCPILGLPFRAPQSPAPLCKILFLVNLSHNYYNFNKTCFINKNILEITTKFIP